MRKVLLKWDFRNPNRDDLLTQTDLEYDGYHMLFTPNHGEFLHKDSNVWDYVVNVARSMPDVDMVCYGGFGTFEELEMTGLIGRVFLCSKDGIDICSVEPYVLEEGSEGFKEFIEEDPPIPRSLPASLIDEALKSRRIRVIYGDPLIEHIDMGLI